MNGLEIVKNTKNMESHLDDVESLQHKAQDLLQQNNIVRNGANSIPIRHFYQIQTAELALDWSTEVGACQLVGIRKTGQA